MKKFLGVCILLLGTLIPIGATASPASAACGAKAWVASSALNINNGSSDSGYKIVGRVQRSVCANEGVRVYAYKIDYTATGIRCGTGVQAFRGNPNVLANWNPGTLSTSCSNNVDFTQFWDAPGAYVLVTGSMASNLRCIGATITKVVNNYPDNNYNLPTICVI